MDQPDQPPARPDPEAMFANPAAIDSNAGDFRSVLYTVDRQGRRKWIYAHIVQGAWRRWRQWLSVLLIGFYLALPFLTVGGRPFLRFDLPRRQFWIAGQVFWPQDFNYFLLLFLIGVVGTLLAVALLGRVYCGWLCPHNVFLEMVFRPIERLVQGDAFTRARKDREGRGGAGRVLTFALFVLVSGALANTATALFVGTEAFAWGLVVDPAAHPAAALFFAFAFVLILFNFSWFREQTCTIVCPYGRLQSVMLDPHSLVVGYDQRRGEPRGRLGTTSGDCIDCKLCVAVCPTGIDIRNGNQLECIHCSGCIDACDAVMTKLGKPTGLVRYTSEIELAGGRRLRIRPRTMIYALVATALIGVATWRILHREDIVATMLRPSSMPVFADNAGVQMVRQPVSFSLVNKTASEHRLTPSLPAHPDARIYLQQPVVVVPPNQRVELTPTIDLPAAAFGPGDLRTTLLFVREDGQRLELPILLRRP
jgi:cytochrome c oxidase accessory protein FixG